MPVPVFVGGINEFVSIPGVPQKIGGGDFCVSDLQKFSGVRERPC
jgi:hypothetical protein